ncbi:ester cyclase [Mycobacterium montefiorense]|uniref:ester cyclase n=1 Tax=Mycobacterium montefiorense TaxID=154654 RepID=UPI0021F25B67|nr:ester cyclase [Mycobacterium montefiorense]MCV7428629.1 ester cyclase [Mycobacterium montefiorense]
MSTSALPVDPLVAQRFYDRWLDAWNQDDIDRVRAIVTEDFVLSSPTTRLTGMRVDSATAIRDYIGYIRRAYPDLIFEQVGFGMFDLEHPVVAFPWSGTGTFTGRMDPPGIPGTGRSFDFSGIEVFTFRGDRVSHLYASYDLLRMLRQSGVLGGSWADEQE